MKTQSPDTTPEAEHKLIELVRRAPAWKRARQIAELNYALRVLTLAGLRRSHPQADASELRRRLAARLLPPEYWSLYDKAEPKLEGKLMANNPLEVLLQVGRVLDELSARYVVVGSFASSMKGFGRTTGDVDIVSDLTVAQALSFIAGLEEDFYVDEQSVRRAFRTRRSFNLIHLDSMFKVDVFLPPENGFGWQQLARRQALSITPDSTQQIYVATAEDTVLAKLQWYVQGGATSDQQWSDILGVLKIQGNRIDADYMNEWSDRLDVRSLLEKAFDEAR